MQRSFSPGLTDLSSGEVIVVSNLSAKPVAGATLADLDPVERARLRQFIERFNGDRALLELDDAQLDAALSLTVRTEQGVLPSLAGLLLLGREASLRALVPTHEIAFQMLDGEEVRFNEFSRAPLLRAFEWVETLFKPLNIEPIFLCYPVGMSDKTDGGNARGWRVLGLAAIIFSMM